MTKDLRNTSPQEDQSLREKLTEKNRRLKRLRERLGNREQEVADLKSELARVQGIGYTSDLSYENSPVFFVVGQAKSGTSWLMRLLNAHPDILCRGEGRFFGRDFIRDDLLTAEQSRIQPASLYRALLEADYLRAWIERSVWTRGDDSDEHLENLTRMATNYFLSQRRTQSGKKIVGDKTPFLSPDMLKEIGEIYPEARVIHIIRDGRDVAVSLTYHKWNHSTDRGGPHVLDADESRKREAYENAGGLIGTQEGLFTEKMVRSMATGWRNQISRARQDGQTLLGVNYTEVKYEDLLERPEEEARALLEFLGADTSERVVRDCVTAASFENWTDGRRRGQEDSASFFRKGVAGDWKNVFTEVDKQVFKEAAGGLLVELGYEEDESW